MTHPSKSLFWGLDGPSVEERHHDRPTNYLGRNLIVESAGALATVGQGAPSRTVFAQATAIELPFVNGKRDLFRPTPRRGRAVEPIEYLAVKQRPGNGSESPRAEERYVKPVESDLASAVLGLGACQYDLQRHSDGFHAQCGRSLAAMRDASLGFMGRQSRFSGTNTPNRLATNRRHQLESGSLV